VGDASGASCLATERVNHGVLVGNAKRYARGGIGALRAGEWLAGMGEEEEAKLCQAPKVKAGGGGGGGGSGSDFFSLLLPE
jgi:hypothetical protein